MKYFKKIISVLIILIVAIVATGCREPENTDPIPLDTSYTDTLMLESAFAGKDFITDGIGEVTLNRCVDGDTITVNSGTSITIRFLGVNTPESTGRVEAWGKAASAFVKEKLEAAQSIVLEAEGERLDSTGRRYLAWIWYQPTGSAEYRLINLELIELAFSKYMINTQSKYFDVALATNQKAARSLERVWGGIDPDFNYSKEVVESNLLYMLNHHDEFQSGTKFLITVKLIRTVGNNMFLEDAYDVSYDDDGEVVSGKGTIYAFHGYTVAYYRSYKIGDIFTIQCQLEYEGQFGTQLTGLAKASRVIENVTPEILEINADDLNGAEELEIHYGRVIKLNNLKCISVTPKTTTAGDDYFVVVAENASGQKFDIYFGNSLITTYDVANLFTIGSYYNIIGGVAFYEFANGQYQLSVGDAPRYSSGILNEEDILRLNDIEEVE